MIINRACDQAEIQSEIESELVIPFSDHNYKITIKAARDGLDFDGRYILTWEWILRAKELADNQFGETAL